jgi:nitrite reductase/ring-hydroxylating ferredoxin subunit
MAMTHPSSDPLARTPSHAHDCAGCALHDGVDDSRRQFLRDAALAVAGIAAVLGLPARASALETTFGAALRVEGTKAAYALPGADGATIDKEREVILVRWQGTVYAFALSCPHQRTMLKWRDDDGGRFQCPKHKSKYRPDGSFISGRATRGMDRYAVRRAGGQVEVDTARVFKEDEDKAGWDAAQVRL